MEQKFKVGDIVISKHGTKIQVTDAGKYLGSFSGTVLESRNSQWVVGNTSSGWTTDSFSLVKDSADTILNQLDKLEQKIKNSI